MLPQLSLEDVRPYRSLPTPVSRTRRLVRSGAAAAHGWRLAYWFLSSLFPLLSTRTHSFSERSPRGLSALLRSSGETQVCVEGAGQQRADADQGTPTITC